MNINQILVIRFSSLGDIILLTPLFREIKKQFPQAKLDFLTSTTFAGTCRNNPHIDRIIILDRKKGIKELFRTARLCRKNDYDLVFDAHRSPRSRLLLLKCFGIFNLSRKRILQIDKRNFQRNLLLLTGINLFDRPISQREAYGNMLKIKVAAPPPNLTTELFPGKEEARRVRNILHQFHLEGKRLVAVGPSASFPGKCWPKEYFLELSKRLQKAGYTVVLLGGGNDAESQWIFDSSKNKPVNLSGQLSYLQSAELLRHCQLSISNDSAVAHFAEAMGTSAIAIFGPTSKEFGYAPFLNQSLCVEIPMKCRPCSRNGKGKCKNNIKRQCLRDIRVETVLKHALEILT